MIDYDVFMLLKYELYIDIYIYINIHSEGKIVLIGIIERERHTHLAVQVLLLLLPLIVEESTIIVKLWTRRVNTFLNFLPHDIKTSRVGTKNFERS